MSGGFNFQVNDGVNFTPRQIFSITARALVLILEKNGPLKVFPGKSYSQSKVLSSKDKSGVNLRFLLLSAILMKKNKPKSASPVL